ncbi:MAG: ATP-binding cassette domain-containing protein [Methylobacteriaceae bacterium]|nr:ATP-binding cassette domain-containing protein [Methylobacteriaceae bacterium]
MPPPLLDLKDIALTLGGTPLLESAGLAIGRGEKICLVGRNGSGKSTLLRIAAGPLEPDRGIRFLQPGTSLRYLPQEPDLSGFKTVLAYAEAGLDTQSSAHRAEMFLADLGLTGEEDPAKISGGEARRAALARVLAADPDILLLDEPTNHLDLPTIEWLEAALKSSRAAIVLVSHDRRFLENLSHATVWLDRGCTRRLEQGFAAFESWRDKLLEEEQRDAHKLERKIAAEEDWVRYGVTARRKRNVRRMAELAALRQEKRDARRQTGEVAFATNEGRVSGRLVIEAKRIAKNFGERIIVRDLSLRILRSDRLGIVGANGAGKTTLINILTGELRPDSGTLRHGANLDLATLDQKRAALNPDATLADTLTGGGSDYVEVGGAKKHVVGYMRDFLFQPEQARSPVGKLSGGERARLMLARALALPSNLLVLDEPTNDLDLETLELLEEMLADYPGTVIVVSHDRDFLDHVATSVLVAEGDGRWIEYAGGYSDMLKQRGSSILSPGREEPAKKGEPSSPKQRRPQSATRRLSFKEKHALEKLPAEMERLRAQRSKLQALLADPQLYSKDPKRFAEASAAFTKAGNELAQAEERWLELEILREQVEGSVL